jgi:hypothetical protein
MAEWIDRDPSPLFAWDGFFAAFGCTVPPFQGLVTGFGSYQKPENRNISKISVDHLLRH